MGKTGVSATARCLTQRLMALEAALEESAKLTIDTCPVCEKLRISLSTTLGLDSYRFLLGQALTSAKQEVAILVEVSVREDGSIEGLCGEAAAASSVLIAHLLSSMETVVGEVVTRWILSDVWPGMSDVTSNTERHAHGNRTRKSLLY